MDYAILEPRSAKGEAGSRDLCLPADFAWNDLGSWAALHEHSHRRARMENVFDAGDQVRCEIDAARNYVYAPGKAVALVGVDDLVVVDTGDCLLITAPRPLAGRRQGRSGIEKDRARDPGYNRASKKETDERRRRWW